MKTHFLGVINILILRNLLELSRQRMKRSLLDIMAMRCLIRKFVLMKYPRIK